jgi:tRNA pseudouridine13 synthase
VSAPAAEVAASVTQLEERGFVNYYGMQRFGTTAVATPDVGRALLRSAYKEAIELLLSPRDGGTPARSAPCPQAFLHTRKRLDVHGKGLGCRGRGGAAGCVGA